MWEEVVGHEERIAELRRLSQRGFLPHAMLFSGPNGVGKRTIAYTLAAEVLGMANPTAQHPDLHLLSRDEDRSEITVDNIRELLKGLSLRPYYGGARFVIIDNAEEMNIAAANTLLTTLESPGNQVFFVLITSNVHRILPTIISRTQNFSFGYLTSSEVSRIIAKRFPENISEEQLAQIVAAFPGSLDYLKSLIDDPGLIPDFTTKIKTASAAVEAFIRSLGSTTLPHSGIAAFSSAATTNKEDLPLYWRLLFAALQRRLREEVRDETATTQAAEILYRGVQLEQLQRERHLNAALQLTDLLNAGFAANN
jgi:MoxR-like ATPase